MSAFRWTRKREKAALTLAQGYTQCEAAAEAKVTDRTIRRWNNNLEFAMEVDRLTLLTGISTRAERMRIVMTIVRDKIAAAAQKEIVASSKDILEWLKFAQSETDGAKLDLSAVFAALGAQTGSDDEGGEEDSAEASTSAEGETDATPLDAQPRAADGGPPY